MAKFGLLPANGDKPLQEFQGDFLQVNGENVLIFANDGSGTTVAMHVIRLMPGYVVKRIGS